MSTQAIVGAAVLIIAGLVATFAIILNADNKIDRLHRRLAEDYEYTQRYFITPLKSLVKVPAWFGMGAIIVMVLMFIIFPDYSMNRYGEMVVSYGELFELLWFVLFVFLWAVVTFLGKPILWLLLALGANITIGTTPTPDFMVVPFTAMFSLIFGVIFLTIWKGEDNLKIINERASNGRSRPFAPIVNWGARNILRILIIIGIFFALWQLEVFRDTMIPIPENNGVKAVVMLLNDLGNVNLPAVFPEGAGPSADLPPTVQPSDDGPAVSWGRWVLVVLFLIGAGFAVYWFRGLLMGNTAGSTSGADSPYTDFSVPDESEYGDDLQEYMSSLMTTAEGVINGETPNPNPKSVQRLISRIEAFQQRYLADEQYADINEAMSAAITRLRPYAGGGSGSSWSTKIPSIPNMKMPSRKVMVIGGGALLVVILFIFLRPLLFSSHAEDVAKDVAAWIDQGGSLSDYAADSKLLENAQQRSVVAATLNYLEAKKCGTGGDQEFTHLDSLYRSLSADQQATADELFAELKLVQLTCE